MRAAASSMARGRPSNRTQISAIADAFSLLSSKSGLTAVARATNKATAEYSDSASIGGKDRESGRASGGTRKFMFPIHVKHGPAGDHDFETGSDGQEFGYRKAPRRSTCSKLSSTSSIGVRNQSRKVSLSISSGAFAPTSRIPSV